VLAWPATHLQGKLSFFFGSNCNQNGQHCNFLAQTVTIWGQPRNFLAGHVCDLAGQVCDLAGQVCDLAGQVCDLAKFENFVSSLGIFSFTREFLVLGGFFAVLPGNFWSWEDSSQYYQGIFGGFLPGEGLAVRTFDLKITGKNGQKSLCLFARK